MNRAKIKERAKVIIQDNLWNILKPYIGVAIISSLVTAISGVMLNTGTVLGEICYYALKLAVIPLSFGYTAFILKFSRLEDVTPDEVSKYYKNFVPVILLSVLISIYTTLWSLLLIVPGIIAAISYQQATYIMIDGEEDPKECIRKSKEMMNGYKMDYFTFMLSFAGWYLLIPLTLGLAAVYVMPYVSVSQALYYDEMKKIQKF